MALVAQDLADAMIAALAGKTTPAAANTALGNAIALYIQTNAEISFSWSGASASIPPVNDPVTTDKGVFDSCSISLTPSMLTASPAALTALALQLQLGMVVATYKMSQAFVVSPGICSSITPMASLSISGSTAEETMLDLATKIIAWVTAYVPSVPCTGVHGIFAGSGTPSKIE